MSPLFIHPSLQEEEALKRIMDSPSPLSKSLSLSLSLLLSCLDSAAATGEGRGVKKPPFFEKEPLSRSRLSPRKAHRKFKEAARQQKSDDDGGEGGGK